MVSNHAAQFSSVPQIHQRFLVILPRIIRHGKVCFRGFHATLREEAIAEMIALSWMWYRRLMERGKNPDRFPSALASYSAKAVRCGRRVCGQEKAQDVLSQQAQQRQGFRVESLPTSTRRSHERLHSTGRGQHHLDSFEERLRDNTLTPVPDQVSFRIDFRDWLMTRTERERRMIEAMILNRRTQELANKFGVSPSRISQLRGEFQQDWQQYIDPLPAGTSS